VLVTQLAVQISERKYLRMTAHKCVAWWFSFLIHFVSRKIVVVAVAAVLTDCRGENCECLFCASLFCCRKFIVQFLEMV